MLVVVVVVESQGQAWEHKPLKSKISVNRRNMQHATYMRST